MLKQKSGPTEKAFIQHVYTDESNLCVITFSVAQARVFHQAEWFQMDMTWQRLAGSIRELVITKKEPTLQQGIVISRRTWYLPVATNSYSSL